MVQKIYKNIFTKSDGRRWIQFSRTAFDENFTVLDQGHVRPTDWEAPKLRYNRMRDEYVAISASRNNRPFLPPKEFCPLCPVSSYESDLNGNKVKTDTPITNKEYEWAVFENMFPGLSEINESGHAEVVLYAPEHDGSLARSSEQHIEGLIQVWQDRSKEIGAMNHVKQVFIFENKGEEVGVTLHHPHGQIYGFNHIPPFIKAEWETAKTFHKTNNACLICDIIALEIEFKERIVINSETIVAFVPEAARYPYEVHITCKNHRPRIEDLTENEVEDLARVLKELLQKYNKLFDKQLPYIMAHHQAPHGESSPHYHWHIEFYPPNRTKEKLKYLAGVESGTGMFINDTVPEQKAHELRTI